MKNARVCILGLSLVFLSVSSIAAPKEFQRRMEKYHLETCWICPICSNSLENCRCIQEDYKGWRESYSGMVFCGVLVCPKGKIESSEWIDPINEGSISRSDFTGWHLPNQTTRDKMVEYLKMAEENELAIVEIGIQGWWSYADEPMDGFYEGVRRDLE